MGRDNSRKWSSGSIREQVSYVHIIHQPHAYGPGPSLVHGPSRTFLEWIKPNFVIEVFLYASLNITCVSHTLQAHTYGLGRSVWDLRRRCRCFTHLSSLVRSKLSAEQQQKVQQRVNQMVDQGLARVRWWNPGEGRNMVEGRNGEGSNMVEGWRG